MTHQAMRWYGFMFIFGQKSIKQLEPNRRSNFEITDYARKKLV